MRDNVCNGVDCTVSFYGSTHRCYDNKDACDYDDTYCTGSRADCSISTLKPIPGSPITKGTIQLAKSSTEILPTSSLDLFGSSLNVNLQSQLDSVSIQLSQFTVPCGTVNFTLSIFHLTTGGEVQPGASPLTLSTGRNSVTHIEKSGTAKTVTIASSSLQTNNVYRVQVLASNVRQNIIISFSLPLFIDVTPPVFTGRIYDGPKPTSDPFFTDIDYQTDLTTLSVHWEPGSFKDDESNILANGYSIAVGTAAGRSDVSDYMACILQTPGSCSVSSLRLQPGNTYFVSIRATNQAGSTVSASSDGITMDTTAPIPGIITPMLKEDPSLRYLHTEPTLQVAAVVSNFRDDESGIGEDQFSWQLCLSDGRCSQQGFQPFKCLAQPCTLNVTQPSDPITSLTSLMNNARYRVEIQATNGVGLSVTALSPEFLVDLEPPVPGIVRDGLVGDITYQSSQTSLSANWDEFVDAESGVQYYEFIIMTPDKKILEQQNVGLATMATSDNLALSDKAVYSVCVRGTDYAGHTSEACSNGVTIDASPPSGGQVFDLRPEGGSLTDVDYQTSVTTIRARWLSFNASSGLSACSWAIGTAPGSSDIQEFQQNGLTTTAANIALNLTPGSKYFVSVRCTSRSGLSSTATSDGVTPDDTPPRAGMVWDLCTNNCTSADDVNFTAINTALSVRWSAFQDDESGIDSYSWNYANCESSALLRPTSFEVQGSLQDSRSGHLLTTAVRYCVHVRAVNRAGLSSTAQSDGVYVDITAPLAGTVHDGLVFGQDRDHQGTDSVLHAAWKQFSDPQSQLASQEIMAGTSPGQQDTMAAVTIPITTLSYTMDRVKLTDLQMYYITVCATNFVGTKTCSSSDGVLVDLTAPTKGVVFTGHSLQGQLYQSDMTSLTARWKEFYDLHTDIQSFSWGIGTSSTTDDVLSLQQIGLNMSATARGLNLKNGETYFVIVDATNRAGLTTRQTANITIDSNSTCYSSTAAATLKEPLQTSSGQA